MDGAELEQLSEGLAANGLLAQYDYLYTGYIGSVSFLEKVLSLHDALLLANPLIKFVCDPVIGDEGKFYVPEAMVETFVSKVLSRSYMITPNQFEAELLSGIKIRSQADVVAAAQRLLSMGPEIVVITSTELEEHPGLLCCFVLERAKSTGLVMTRVTVPKLDGHYTGTGDVAAALLLAWTHRLGPGQGGQALARVQATMQALLGITSQQQSAKRAKEERLFREAHGPELPFAPSSADEACWAELCIVQGRGAVVTPPPLDSNPLFSLESWVL
jgi:pyridoxine kinase